MGEPAIFGVVEHRDDITSQHDEKIDDAEIFDIDAGSGMLAREKTGAAPELP